ncbi:uncharacterized protein RHO17_004002 [Thomomys bottae]
MGRRRRRGAQRPKGSRDLRWQCGCPPRCRLAVGCLAESTGPVLTWSFEDAISSLSEGNIHLDWEDSTAVQPQPQKAEFSEEKKSKHTGKYTSSSLSGALPLMTCGFLCMGLCLNGSLKHTVPVS